MTYNNFIQNILDTRGRFNCKNEYHERHHIVPKSQGGNNDEDNLIDLYAQEHFIAHKLLVQENPQNWKLTQAYAIMAFAENDNEKRYELTPEEYEAARIALSLAMKEKYKNKENHPCFGKHLSEERKQMISKINKGNKYCLGRVLSEETKLKISQANKNPSEEKRKKMSEAQKKRNLSGGNNTNAKKVIRLVDNKIYDCVKEAAEDNNINYSTFKNWVRKNKNGFMYYKTWLEQKNNNT